MSMSKARRYALLSCILFIATFFRFYHFESAPPGLYVDEAINGNYAVEAAETNHFQVVYFKQDGREGLYSSILAVIFKVFPIYEPWIIRLPAHLAGILTVWGLYLLGAELFDQEIGLLAAFLLSTSVWHIIFSRIGFRAILSPLFLVWALWLLVRSFPFRDHNPGSPVRQSTITVVLAGIVYGLGFYTYIAYRITPILLLLFIPFFKRIPHFWRNACLFILTVLAVCTPIAIYFAQHPSEFVEHSATLSVVQRSAHPAYEFAYNMLKQFLMFTFHGDRDWRHNFGGESELFRPVGGLFLLGIFIGLHFLWRFWRRNDAKELRNRRDSLVPLHPFSILLVFAWLIIGAVPAAASDDNIPHSLRSILTAPAAMILAAIGGVWLYRFIAPHLHVLTIRTISVAFLALITGFAYWTYFIKWANHPNVAAAFDINDYKIANDINTIPRGTPKYVVVDPLGLKDRGISLQAQSIMFITHSFTVTDADGANIHYLTPDQIGTIPKSTPADDIFTLDSGAIDGRAPVQR
jgi:4-amino-4-deoxy-L-arabinose transferase-like glycosyltransferase